MPGSGAVNSAPAPQLKRVLGGMDAGWIVAGCMIGAGIFITPGLVAGKLPGLGWPLLAWTLGGVLALCGAAVYAELGARLPHAGGDYQYLVSAFGPMWGFLTGWAALIATFSAAAAVMAVVTVDHLLLGWPWLAATPLGIKPLTAPLLVLLLTWVNTAGARVSGWTTTLLTAVPLAGLAGLFAAGLLSGTAEMQWPVSPPVALPTRLLALGAAMLPVFFTYSGWNAAAYVAGEIKDPARNLTRGLLGGTLFVTAVYLAVNLALLLLVPQELLAGSTTAGSQAARLLLGPTAERVLAFLIALAVLGTANVTLMAGARIYYAMALDGLMPRALARTNAAGVPAAALWTGGIWTGLLAMTDEVAHLVTWSTLAILLLSSLAVTALFVLRRRDGPAAPFRCPGYPVTPAVYLLASVAVACSSAVVDWKQALYGILIVATGLPVYLLVRTFGSWIKTPSP